MSKATDGKICQKKRAINGQKTHHQDEIVLLLQPRDGKEEIFTKGTTVVHCHIQIHGLVLLDWCDSPTTENWVLHGLVLSGLALRKGIMDHFLDCPTCAHPLVKVS